MLSSTSLTGRRVKLILMGGRQDGSSANVGGCFIERRGHPSINLWALSLETIAVNNGLNQGQQIAVPCSVFFYSLVHIKVQVERTWLWFEFAIPTFLMLRHASKWGNWQESDGLWECTWTVIVFAIWDRNRHPVQLLCYASIQCNSTDAWMTLKVVS